MSRRGHSALRAGLPLLALFLLVGLAVLVRALGFEAVILDDGVVFPIGDPQYHVRRAFYTYVNFPAVLLFDHYINYPGGASVPWPPLYDFVAGGVAHALGADVRGFELVLAWIGPVVSALGVVPVYLIGRRMDSRLLGLLAGLVFALLRDGAHYARVGYADHHAAVGTLGAWLLYACIRTIEVDRETRDEIVAALLLVVTRLALLLTWHGSLLYLALLEGSMLLAAIIGTRGRVACIQSASAIATLLLLTPILLASPTPLGGTFSSIALSWLHVIALLGVAAVAASLHLLRRAGFQQAMRGRFVLVVALSVGFVFVLLILPWTREGLLPAFQFLTMTDAMGARTLEQMPLFEVMGRSAGPSVHYFWGLLGYFIPIAPAAILCLPAVRRGRSGRTAAIVVAGWGGFFGLLTLFQLRYGNDYSPTACLLFATALLGAGRLAAAKARGPGEHPILAAGVAVALFLVLYWTPIARVYIPQARGSLAALGGARDPAVRYSVFGTLTRFAREIRSLTPATRSFLADEGEPEYGIIADPNLGHAIQNVARRPTATDPFWSYIGQENWDSTMALQASTRESEVLQLAEKLNGRYALTMPTSRGLMKHLHDRDGRPAQGWPRLEHFRLVAEAPQSGQSLAALYGPRPTAETPYKLFEIVPGAVLDISAPAGEQVSVSLELQTAQGRSFVYRARRRAGADGRVELIVPYASEPPTDQAGDAARSPAIRALGPYAMRAGDRMGSVIVSDAAVKSGERIPLRVDSGIWAPPPAESPR